MQYAHGSLQSKDNVGNLYGLGPYKIRVARTGVPADCGPVGGRHRERPSPSWSRGSDALGARGNTQAQSDDTHTGVERAPPARAPSCERGTGVVRVANVAAPAGAE